MIVTNKDGVKTPDGLNRAEFERGIEGKVDFAIPFDAKAVGAAVNAGKPIAEQATKAKITLALRELAGEIAGVQAVKKRKRAFLGLGASRRS